MSPNGVALAIHVLGASVKHNGFNGFVVRLCVLKMCGTKQNANVFIYDQDLDQTLASVKITENKKRKWGVLE